MKKRFLTIAFALMILMSFTTRVFACDGKDCGHKNNTKENNLNVVTTTLKAPVVVDPGEGGGHTYKRKLMFDGFTFYFIKICTGCGDIIVPVDMR